MSNVQQFIDLIGQGQNSQAQEALSNILSAKAFEALETFKQDVGASIFATEEAEHLDEVTKDHPFPGSAFDKPSNPHLHISQSYLDNHNKMSKRKDLSHSTREVAKSGNTKVIRHSGTNKAGQTEYQHDVVHHNNKPVAYAHRDEDDGHFHGMVATHTRDVKRGITSNHDGVNAMAKHFDDLHTRRARMKNQMNKEEFYFEDYSLEEIEDFMISEDFEQLDELSKNTLGSYVKKAHFQGGMADYKQGTLANAGKSAKDKRNEYGTTSEKRQKGINRAVDKLTREEAEQLDEVSLKTASNAYVERLRRSEKEDGLNAKPGTDDMHHTHKAIDTINRIQKQYGAQGVRKAEKRRQKADLDMDARPA